MGRIYSKNSELTCSDAKAFFMRCLTLVCSLSALNKHGKVKNKGFFETSGTYERLISRHRIEILSAVLEIF